jgi:hypothetical protein
MAPRFRRYSAAASPQGGRSIFNKASARRSLVAGAATLPALAGSAAAITPDPAFAAVEHYNTLQAACARLDQRGEWDQVTIDACNAAENAPATKAGAIKLIKAWIEVQREYDVEEINQQFLQSSPKQSRIWSEANVRRLRLGRITNKPEKGEQDKPAAGLLTSRPVPTCSQ